MSCSAGSALLVAADLLLAQARRACGRSAFGVVLWGAHMALTQGIFSRMIADAASEEQRATSFGAFFFASGIAALLASLGAGLLWDRERPGGDLHRRRRAGRAGGGDAGAAA